MPYIAYMAPTIPGGWFAVYSVRRIVPGYSGYAFRVRRSSDNATLDVGFVDNTTGALYDAAAALSFCGVNTGYALTWYDQSGHGYDITVGAGTASILCSGGSTFTRGGFPSVNMNGASTAAIYQFPTGIPHAETTGALVAYVTHATTGGGTLFGGDNPNSMHVKYAGQILMNRQNVAFVFGSGSATTVGLHTFYGSGGSSASVQTLGIDGVATTLNSTPAFTQDVRAIGNKADTNTEKWDDGISEVLLYDRVLTSAEWAALQADQKAFFGTP